MKVSTVNLKDVEKMKYLSIERKQWRRMICGGQQ